MSSPKANMFLITAVFVLTAFGLAGCLSDPDDDYLLIPPKQITVRVTKGSAVIHAELRYNPYISRKESLKKNARDKADGRYTPKMLEPHFCGTGETYTLEIAYGYSLMLTVRAQGEDAAFTVQEGRRTPKKYTAKVSNIMGTPVYITHEPN